jgi:hypothetical protein
MSIDSKILKYVNKSLEKNDKVYLDKLRYYIGQKGGSIYSEFVTKVVLDEYNFNYLKPLIQEKLKDMKCATDNTVMLENLSKQFESHEIDNTIVKLGCFSTTVNSNEDYLFKSGLKGKITDIFVRTIGRKLFTYLAYKIIKEMSEMVDTYVKEYNAKYVNLKIKIPSLQNITKDDIVYLYKGGNIIRMYLSNLSQSIIDSIISDKSSLEKKIIIDDLSEDRTEQIVNNAMNFVIFDSKKTQPTESTKDSTKDTIKSEDLKQFNKLTQGLTKEQKISMVLKLIEDTLGKEKYGDYDMSFAINQDLNKTTYEKISRDLNALLIYKLQILKKEVKNVMTYIIDKKLLVNAYSKDFVNDQTVNDIIHSHNADWTLDSMSVFGKLISKTEITDLNETDISDTINKNSLIVTTRDQNTGSKNFIEVKKILVNSNFTDIVDVSDIEKNDIFLTQSNAHIIFVNNETTFTIARLKINTVCAIKEKKLDEITHKDIKFSFPIELIDVAIPTQNDFQSKEINNFLYKNHYDKHKEFHHETEMVTLPSIYYLYTDLKIVLFQNLFVWEDKKYEKRLLRLILLALYASLDVESKSHIVDYSKLKKHIDEILQFFAHQVGIGMNNIFMKENYDLIKQKFKYGIDQNEIKLNLVNMIDNSFFAFLMQIYIRCLILALGIMKEENIIGEEINMSNHQEYYNRLMKKTKQKISSPGSLVMIEPYSYYAKHINEYTQNINDFAITVVTYLGFVSEILSVLITKPSGIKLSDKMDEF